MRKTNKTAGSVFKRPGSPFYYARWWVNGKEHVESTKEKTKPEAEIVKDRLVAMSRDDYSLEDAFTSFVSTLAKVEDLAERDELRRKFTRRLAGEATEKLHLSAGWNAWLDNPNKKRTPKEVTLTGYKAIWKRFENWITPKESIYFHEIERSHSEQYAEELWKSHVSPTTYNAHIKFLTHMFNVLKTKAGLTENIWADITRKEKAADQGRRNLTEDELKTIFERAKGNVRKMIALGLFTGLRLGDVVNLRWDEIDHDRFNRLPKQGFIVVKPMKTVRKNKVVQVPIHPVLRAILVKDRTAALGEYLFPIERGLYAENAGNLTSTFQEFFKTCGIETTEKSVNGERRRAIVRVGFHSLRHSFVSLCAKAGTPIHVVQKLVGHGSPLLTADIYTHLDDEQKQEAVQGLPTLGFTIRTKSEQKAVRKSANAQARSQ
ncbi:MAG TPA: tyrosine-type recombinase/integrase [Verrucomicrobiae bacterium]|nr:tyrosine-type recombinase/integrase [Verrucomicrobiae bacterium]